MKLFLIRHGTAQAHRASEQEDKIRGLVEKGRKQSKMIGQFFRAVGATPEIILTSPLKRATQTAEEILRWMEIEAGETRIEQEKKLRPDVAPAEATKALAKRLDDKKCLFAVGHEPQLSSIAALIVANENLTLDLRKAGVIEIQMISLDPPRGQLVGLLRPKYLFFNQ